jgi:prefoldin subunit 5
MSEYSETSQLRTRCTILESQLHALTAKNAKLQERIEQLENSSTKQGKEGFPINYDDGSFAI